MCFAALLNGDATARPIREIVREELPRSLGNGTVAAAIVVAVLLVEGTGVGLTAAMALGAIVLGAVLHQSLLLCGVGLLRRSRRLRRRVATES